MKISHRVKIIESRVAFKEWSKITSTKFLYQRNSGEWQEQIREVSDHGDGAAILLYNLHQRSVVLVRQFRFVTFSTGLDAQMIEVPAGLLDDMNPDERIRLEAEEETGFAVSGPVKIMAAFASPGSLTERVHLYVAAYEPEHRVAEGGGKHEEGEDIEVLEMPFEEAMTLVAEGGIADMKTIILLQYAALHFFHD
jgi:nudix-type nucleoside diphosphatase (YffH/AdpP family)